MTANLDALRALIERLTDNLGWSERYDLVFAQVSADDLKEAIAALEQAASTDGSGYVRVPSGWQTVPVEPTEAMVDAAISAGSETEHGGYEAATEREIYRVMLAAAPAPASKGPMGAEIERVAQALKNHWVDIIADQTMMSFSKEERMISANEMVWDGYARAAIGAMTEAGDKGV